MPTYEYDCERCGHRFEVFQSMTERPRKRCPKCRGKLRRLLGGGAGMIFKGSGFYTTDYRSKSYKEQKRKESGETPKKKDEAKGAPPKPARGAGT
ncbi:MAG: zinc ribbon domain-containing protein [Candidatus Latescibacteria bacterium]|nr:zinc ribbon domain-containing protein [Candidatus Latescibacterota bacterium]